jgi:N-acetylmuramoyl-L-alanine amidase
MQGSARNELGQGDTPESGFPRTTARIRGLSRIGAVVLFAAVGLSCSRKESVKIIDKPISFSPQRIEATKVYMAEHYGLDTTDIEIDPKMIVIHWTAIDSFDSCWNLFNRETLSPSRTELMGAGQVNVAIQFLVDRDGAIYRLMPETWMARHVIGLNHCAIGVENVGGGNGVDNLTDAQLEANVHLVRYLKGKYSGIEYLIGHHEYRAFENSPLWLERDPDYRTDKYDPGDRFMAALRQRVEDLHLESAADVGS